MSVIYSNAIELLTSQGKFYINLGLERVQRVLDILGNPQRNLEFIHVAGTNGKGSVCAMLSAILKNAKIQRCEDALPEKYTSHLSPLTRVGLFTSPHIFEYTERIKINDIEIGKDVFGQKIIEITKLAQEHDIHLTEFEILTVVAFDYFVQNNVNVVVLETGLGGRLDATNIIDSNLCSIITHIDLDHTERLGDTIEKIAHEKAGIIKNGCPTIIGANNAVFEVVKRVAEERKSTIILAEKKSVRNCSLKGTYQQENLALVLSAMDVLKKQGFNITDEMIEKGLNNVKHPCRFEYLKEQNILIDGAHNPNGTKALRASLDYYYPNRKIKFVFGCLKNKQYPEMLKNLFTKKDSAFEDEIYFYQFNNENSCSYEELATVCEFNSKSFDEFEKDDNILTVICGSFYMIKEVLTKMGIK